MSDWERDQIRSANAGLRAALDEIQSGFDSEIGQLDDIHEKLAAMTIRATSPNNLARVTVNANGMVTQVTIAEDAYRRSTPRQLTDDVNTAIKGGIEAASAARQKLLAPIQTIVDGMADLSDIIPGAPSLRDLQARLSEIPAPPSEQQPR